MMSALRRVVATVALALGGLALGVGPSACESDRNLLSARIITDRSELIGGPVAAADVGDFLLENDQIRVAILGPHASPAPGVFGGSIVDVDRRRPQQGLQNGLGHDRFSEMFPVANLLVPNPAFIDVKVIADGADGKEAILRVEGKGDFLYQALAILRDQKPVLDTIFPNARTSLRFVTDYVLRPGAKHVFMRTKILIEASDQPSGCAAAAGCELDCENGLAQDERGCLVCRCSELLPLDGYTGPTSVFGGILGDSPMIPDPPAQKRAGIVAGDFVFFGNQNNVFAPGEGFDEDTPVQLADLAGRNTFVEPLTFEYVAAAGRDISYGYFAPNAEAPDDAVVNVPIFASAATAFLIAGKQCAFDTADDAACDANRAFTFERYLVVGDGDVASVVAEMDAIRGRKTGHVAGHVVWEENGEGAPSAEILLLADPDPKKSFASLDAVVAANRASLGDAGVLSSIYADRGIDPILDGGFEADLPPGVYLAVAMDATRQALSKPTRIEIREGRDLDVSFALPRLAFVDYRVTDESGELGPAKIAFVALDERGVARTGDAARRVFAGDGRLTGGQRLQELTASGEGRVAIEPGRYRVYVTRGPEVGAYVEELDLAPGDEVDLDASLVHEVDTRGFASIDMHLHSAPSFDSGMALPKRVTAAAAEGLDIAVSTDHDVATDYAPTIRDLGLEGDMTSFVSAEITTLEYGHFIGFPLRYDVLDVPRHGAPDWSCLDGREILGAIRQRGDDMVPFTIVAHPRDGFFGYVDQSGVDTFTLGRKLGQLTSSNPVFRTMSCDFDAMEIMGAKRFDLIRTPSVGEVVDWTRCKARLSAAMEEGALRAACPEVDTTPPESCAAGESFLDCKRRHKSRLAAVFTKRILERTPEEQAALIAFGGDEAFSQAACDPVQFGVDPVPAEVRDLPCAYRAGQVDDFFRYLEYGFTPTQIASSDSHDAMKEPGFPRTYFVSATDAPSAMKADEVVKSLREGKAVSSYGPFVTATMRGKTFGDVVSSSPGAREELLLTVQTPSWFGVDRAEVYVNGQIVRVLSSDARREDVMDLRVSVPIDVPNRDAWIVVIAMGLADQNQMSPVVFELPFGEVQLSQLASGAFGAVPVISDILKAEPSVPDWSPTIPYAITNPIFVDTDGNGIYDSPSGPPPFCSHRCESDDDCALGLACLEDEGLCGIAISGGCDIRRTVPQHD